MLWDILVALLMIGTGIGIIGFGIFLFYTFRPLFYAFMAPAQFVIRRSVQLTADLPCLRLARTIILAHLTTLPVRRNVGILGGVLVGLPSIGLRLGHFLSRLAVIGAVIGVFLVALFFDPLSSSTAI
jgi:hypothetical protein